jgi:FMN phosphatase YigB (HAD superfamily)
LSVLKVEVALKEVVIFDGDNTLWDTDSVFRGAQIALLEVLEGNGFLRDPEAQLTVLRQVDQELASRLGAAEYDFRLLPVAMMLLYSRGETPDRAADLAIAGERSAASEAGNRPAEDAYTAYRAALQSVPPLYGGAESLLQNLGKRRAARLLFSEGARDRIERILRYHQLLERRLLDEVIIMPKDAVGYEHAKARALVWAGRTLTPRDKSLVFLLGDSLLRDIVPGNEAGFITIYKPSPFKGVEQPLSTAEAPALVVASLDEVLGHIDRFMCTG